MGETGENTVPLTNNNQRSMTLIDTEDNNAGEDYFPPLKIFQTCSSQSQYEWSLSKNMLPHFLKQFHSFFPDAELEDSIFKYNPIPSNVLPPAPLDEFLRGVLEKNHKYSQMLEDKLLQKMQQKVLNVLGPLSKIWQKIENSTQCKTDRVEIDLFEFKELTEQSIMMLGQVFNNITYNRCLSVLNALMKEHKFKQMLKEKANIFSESHKELFEQNFREDWCTNLKTKQKYQEVLRKETKSTPTTFSRNRSLFRGALQHHHMEEVVEARTTSILR